MFKDMKNMKRDVQKIYFKHRISREDTIFEMKISLYKNNSTLDISRRLVTMNIWNEKLSKMKQREKKGEREKDVCVGGEYW